MLRSCKTCEFFEKTMKSGEIGVCHRYPPVGQPDGDGLFCFPAVEANDWCGEYRMFGDTPIVRNRAAVFASLVDKVADAS